MSASLPPPAPPKPSFISQLIAGASAGLIADVFMHPVNTLQTNLQSNLSVPRPSVLYRGFGIVALFSAPSHALYFSIYDNLRETSPGLAGLAAELSGTVLLTPSEVLKKRAQVGAAGYAAPLPEVLRGVAKDVRATPLGTVRDLYAGAVLSSAVWLPFSAIYFDSYERLKRVGVPTWLSATAGGGVAALATAPLDVVLTRLQTRHEGVRGFRAAVRSVAKDMAWFKGAGARVAWLAPCSGISLTTYEALASRLDGVFGERKG